MTSVSSRIGSDTSKTVDNNTMCGDSAGNKTGWEFVSQFNPITGRSEWKLVDSNYDFAQEISRSGYGDMLHDTDRNFKYRLAIEQAIAHRRSSYPNDTVRVLDIGTGTGLLSMMAVNAGADDVVACEAFTPVAECARSVLRRNGMYEKVHLIAKHSSDVRLGSDMIERANLLVAELVDTELIGEGALSTYRYAARNLLTDDATLVPYAADLYVQAVECPFLWSHHSLSTLVSDETMGFGQYGHILHSGHVGKCSGAPAVMDIQASELEVIDNDQQPLENRQLRCLLDKPVRLKRFQFSPPVDQIKLEERLLITKTDDNVALRAVRDGTLHAFVVWWRLKMEPTNTVPDINTAPAWVDETDYAWRDHWMQAIYFPKTALPLRKGDEFGIEFNHDSVSLWLDVIPSSSSSDEPIESNSTEDLWRPVCICGLHYAWSRTRIAHLNSVYYRSLIRKLIGQVEQKIERVSMTTDLHLVVCSDSTPLPLLLYNRFDSRDRRVTIHHLETCASSVQFLEPYYRSLSIGLYDSATSLVKNLKQELKDENSLFIFLSEPFASSSLLPWDSLYFSYALSEIKSYIKPSQMITLCPQKIRIWAVLVEFDQLWKIGAPVDSSCEQYDLSDFDKLVQTSMSVTDALAEPHPLWEYRSKAVSVPSMVWEMSLQSVSTSPNLSHSNQVFLQPSSQLLNLNGIALWAEWLFDGSMDSMSYAPAGPERQIHVDDYIDWKSIGVHQAVIFTPQEWRGATHDPGCLVSLCVNCDSSTGEHTFTMNLQETNENIH